MGSRITRTRCTRGSRLNTRLYTLYRVSRTVPVPHTGTLARKAGSSLSHAFTIQPILGSLPSRFSTAPTAPSDALRRVDRSDERSRFESSSALEARFALPASDLSSATSAEWRPLRATPPPRVSFARRKVVGGSISEQKPRRGAEASGSAAAEALLSAAGG